MKKVFCVVMAAVLLVSLLVGCGEKPLPKSGVTAEEILEGFEQQLTSSEQGDYYQTDRPPATAIPDSDEIRHDLVITDNQDGYVYQLKVWSSPEGYAIGVVLTTTNAEYERLAFPTFCLYMCKAMKLSAPDWYAFCEALNLLTGDPRGTMTIDGWEVVAFGGEDILTLSAFFNTQ